jgi:transmembrane sensor
MIHLSEDDADKLSRLWAGESSPAETDELRIWIAADGERARMVHALRRVWDAAGGRSYASEAESVSAAVLAHVQRERVQREQGAGNGTKSRSFVVQSSTIAKMGIHRMRTMTAAAIAATLFLVGGLVLRDAATAPAVSAPIVRTYATTPGQQAIVTLPGGSRVSMGPATTLRVATNSANTDIAVTVTGVALFSVTPQRHTTFTVRTTNAVARVLGTTFLVRQYATDHMARIVVADGRVSVQNARGPKSMRAVVAARAAGFVDDSGQVNVTPNIAVEDYMAWTTGELVFRKTPVRDIAADLSRAYAANIRVADSALARHTLTWSVSLSRITLADALDALTTVLDAHVVQAGDVITIVPGVSGSKKAHDLRLPYTLEKQYGK